MNWHSAGEFLEMGGYGTYVWGAYAVTALLMLIEPILAARRRRRALTQARGDASQSSATPSKSVRTQEHRA
jgi:heme exporter protein D